MLFVREGHEVSGRLLVYYFLTNPLFLHHIL